jgi:hypothetical protein
MGNYGDMKQAARVARYRFRATFHRRWGGYLAIVLLVGTLGGLAMGSAAGARRTQSAYPAFLRSTNPSDLVLPTAVYGLTSTKSGYDPAILRKLAHLPNVQKVATSGSLNASPLLADGKELPPPGDAPANFELSTDVSISGLYVDTDRVAISSGRMLDPARPNELVVSAPVARLLGIHVGSVLHFGFYSNAEEAAPGPSGDQYRPHPYLRMDVKLVGIGERNNAVVQDDVDALGSNFALFSPALGRRLAGCCIQSTDAGLVLAHGNRDVRAAEAALARLSPLLSTHVYVPSIDEAKTERAIEPESIALGVFGLIAALATLLIAGQLIGRQLRAGSAELDVLRALGARPAITVLDGLFGVFGAIVAGAALAALVAIALSPVAPIGTVRHVYPSRGIAFDWSVLGFGVLTLVVVLGAIAVFLAVRGEPSRVAQRANRAARPRSRAVSQAVGQRLPAPAATGVRFALERGRGRNPVPARSAILGAALAVVVVVSTLTFGASLHTLVTRPALYGWNWDYELSGGGGVGNIPEQQAARALAHDPDVAAWSGAYFGEAQIDGVAVPGFGASIDPRVAPPLLSGHGLEHPDQIVLGANTLAQLRRHLGDTVTVNLGSATPVRLTIVGTATMPAIGGSGGGGLHLEMGTGAIISYQNIPPSLRDVSGNTPAGPQAIFVRFRPGADPARARRGLEAIARALSLPTNWGVTVTSVQRPAEIVNYRSMSSTPLYLGAALAAGAVLALALTLVTSVRRRRHDLALLKTFGFTRRQLAGVVAWQSMVAVAIGTLIGIPLGIVIGRALWDLFARQIHVAPEPTVPAAAIALVGFAALILAFIVAAIPGRQAARTRTAVLLRAE